MYETFLSILTFLFQGVVAGIVVMFLSHKLQEQKESNLLRKHALFLWVEVYGHIAVLENILSHDAIPKLSSATSLLFDCQSWKASQIYLTRLSTDNLTLICTYYQAAMSLNLIISGCEGQPLNDTNKFSLTATLTMARRVHALLESCWKD